MGARLGAILGDTIVIGTLAALCILIGAMCGLFVAKETGANVDFMATDWQAELVSIHQAGLLPWLSFLGCSVAGLVVALLGVLYMTVGSSTIRGAGWCHRRLGLVLISNQSGHFPKPMLCLAHLLLGLVTAPLIPIMLIAGQSPLHDKLCGCSIGRRSA